MNTKRAVKCVETGECFESIAEAAQVKGCTRANISRALRKGGVAVGGHWRYSYTVKISEMEVRKARARVCNACRVCGPLSDDTKIDWCATCPVKRISLYQPDDASQRAAQGR